MLEERLIEISEGLIQLHNHAKINPSPGLIANIKSLEQKKENVLVAIDLWKTMKRVCPNYDR